MSASDPRTILSVGIDIGTSTTQVIFSRIAMENTAGYFTIPKVSIVDKEIIYRSDIYTTPLLDRSRIDGDRVREMVAEEFSRAGFTPADTDTGAVIITGESARKENSALVLEKLSGFAGEFVVSTAGPDLEAIIAGKGSGAQQYSEEMSCTAVNLDIGGGTTNIALFDCGRTAGKGCLDIGGRLIRLEPDRTVTYLSPAAALVAESRGVHLREGEPASLADLQEVCRGMTQLLEECLGLAPASALLRQVQTPGSSWLDLTGQKPIRAIFFSGGVADGVYRGLSGGEDPIPYGDIGLLLGQAIREGRLCTAFRLEKGKETIRATVVGAGSYTTTLSGSTITYTDPGVFPLKNVPVLKLTAEEQESAFCGNSGVVAERVRWFLDQSDSGVVVIALDGEPDPSYQRLKALAGALAEASGVLPAGAPLLLVVESDIAKALGQAAAARLTGRAVVSLDSIHVEQNDYIDMGRPLMDGLVVPVVVKTLIFG